MPHLRAARIICAFLSRKLASLCSAVVSHVAFPPASSGDFAETPSSPKVDTRFSRLNRSINDGAFLDFAPEIDDDEAVAFDAIFDGLAVRDEGSLARG